MQDKSKAKALANVDAIGVLGSGDYGRAFCARLVSSQVPVILGSRNPIGRDAFLGQVDSRLKNVPVVTIKECLLKCRIILLAINSADHTSLKNFKDILVGKILIDVSNPKGNSTLKSQAERLQEMLPLSNVVKAFNTVSAYTLNEQETSGESRSVFVCGNDASARGQVSDLAIKMGLQAVDMGGLTSARSLERNNQTLFAGWGKPFILTGFWLIFWLVFAIIKYYIAQARPYDWNRFPCNVLNKVAACMALTLLGICFLPGCIVAIIQLIRGTKYKALPTWLVDWMMMRKQLGLYGLFFALIHTCLSLALLQPGYFGAWFQTSTISIPANLSGDIIIDYGSRMTWIAETVILLGTLAVGLYIIQGIGSLPSVSRSFNWKEWNFIYSSLGLLCLLVSCSHVTVKSFPWWMKMDFLKIVTGSSFLSQVIPYSVLAIRLVLLLPCIHTRLNNIRRGKVYSEKYDKVNENVKVIESCPISSISVEKPSQGGEKVNSAYTDIEAV